MRAEARRVGTPDGDGVGMRMGRASGLGAQQGGEMQGVLCPPPWCCPVGVPPVVWVVLSLTRAAL